MPLGSSPKSRATHRAARTRLLLRTAALAGALFLLAAITLVATGLHDTVAPADAALVLGNTVQPDGHPSPRLQARLDRTLELYQAGWFPRIIVSGGTGKEGRDEATAMADYLVARGVPRETLVEDHEGSNTFASARFTAAWLPDCRSARVLVVSQYFHLPRTALALRRFGVGTVYTAHARYFEARDLYSIAREVVGYAGYLFRRYPGAA